MIAELAREVGAGFAPAAGAAVRAFTRTLLLCIGGVVLVLLAVVAVLLLWPVLDAAGVAP